MNKIFYTCYSFKLKEFLTANGIRYINRNFNERTERPFWVYEMTDKLSELLTVWSSQYE